jgi:hypothetical protein
MLLPFTTTAQSILLKEDSTPLTVTRCICTARAKALRLRATTCRTTQLAGANGAYADPLDSSACACVCASARGSDGTNKSANECCCLFSNNYFRIARRPTTIGLTTQSFVDAKEKALSGRAGAWREGAGAVAAELQRSLGSQKLTFVIPYCIQNVGQ